MNGILKIYTALLMCAYIFLPQQAKAQSPEKMSYQAVVRDGSNNLVKNTSVGIQISILQGSASGAPIYVETHTPTSNANGLITIEIGGGTFVSGSFATIDWSDGPYFVKTETDPAGGTSYSITGTSQLLSVPYALYAKNSGSSTPGPQGPQGLLSAGSSPGNTPYWDGNQWIVNSSNIYNNGGNIGIGTTNPNASAITEISSTNKGFLPPRMTTAQRNAIGSPSDGLIIFNTSTGCPNYYFLGEWVEWCGIVSTATYPAGTTLCTGNLTVIKNVFNPSTGKIWMDRNLGASQIASSSTDVNSYGDLYQWGRRADGHQCLNSSNTSTLSSSNQPITSNFIIASNSPFDWRSPQNTNLWQGVNGINNPCPSGYRIPTEAELNAERLTWSTNDSNGAFASPLKLPMAGYRHFGFGTLYDEGTFGGYWSSTVSSTYSRLLGFSSNSAAMDAFGRANGLSVRCIKN